MVKKALLDYEKLWVGFNLFVGLIAGTSWKASQRVKRVACDAFGMTNILEIADVHSEEIAFI